MGGPAPWIRGHPVASRLVPFVAVFVVATWLHFVMRSEVAASVTRDLSAASAAAVINTLTPAAQVVVSEDCQLGNAAARVAIATGCDGIDAVLMLVGAVAVYPAPWRRKVGGMVLGAALVFVVNTLRIASLWYCLRYWPSFFDTLHLTVGQTVVILSAVAFFAAWSGVFSSPHTRSSTLGTAR